MKTKLIAAAVAAALTIGVVGPTVAPAIAHDGRYDRSEWQRREDARRHHEWQQRQRELERQRTWEHRRNVERQRAVERERAEYWRSRRGRDGHGYGYCGSGRPRTLEEAAWRHRNC